MSKKYVNYHRHTHYSNITTLDCVVKPKDYIERTVELGHDTFVSLEHGTVGNVFEAHMLCEKSKLNLVIGTEAYFVPNRFEKDRRNFHIVLLAVNENGRRAINKALSEANLTGYYYKARIDEEILFNLPGDDVMVTTACCGGIANLDEEFLIRCKNHFKYFYLEIQAHVDEVQVEFNKKILDLHKRLEIPLIHGNDSHYVKPEDSKYRTLFLKAKGISYPEESSFILDFPSYDEIIERYKKQNVVPNEKAIEALDNTLIIKTFTQNINKEIKMPKISKNSNKELKELIQKKWNEEKKNIPKEKHKEYIEGIKYEMDIVQKTHMEDYFLLDYQVVKDAIEKYDCVITRTGRGSAPSFYINKLLGLTDLDRFDSPVTLYPTRFMSIERILQTRSLADIDINVADRKPLIKATKDLLGEDGCHWLLTYKPMQKSSGFRMWCKAIGMHIDEYNEIAKNIDDYVEDVKWKDIIEDSKVFVGVIESMAPSPCSFLLLDTPISEEVGLIKVKDEICCMLDGYYCDAYKYLKNDYLQVVVWDIIDKTCKLAGIEIPTIRELNTLLDEETYKMYELGLTTTLNQADSDFATGLVKRYKPKSVGEMSAFVASIRPGFASLLENFVRREPYTTNVPKLDELLKDSYHYLMYQESIMKYLVWLGMPESQTYDIIKKISKKKFDPQELIELKEGLKNKWIEIVGSEEHFDETWQVIEDAAHYSFNASHSLSYAYDSLYCAYLKSHYPIEYYTVILNAYSGDIEKTGRIMNELKHFGIKLENITFGKSKGEYFYDKESKTIYKGVGSVKYLNNEIGEKLYNLSKEKKYDTFFDLLVDFKGIGMNSRQREILIKLGYFREFGKSKTLMEYIDIFDTYSSRKTFSKDKYMEHTLLRKYCGVETAKMFKDIDVLPFCKELSKRVDDEELSLEERIRCSIEYCGDMDIIDTNAGKHVWVVMDLNTRYTPVVQLYRLRDGRRSTVKIDRKIFIQKEVKQYELIEVCKATSKYKNKLVNGKWTKSDEKDIYIDYEIV